MQQLLSAIRLYVLLHYQGFLKGVQTQRLVYCSKVEGYICPVSTCGTPMLCRKEIMLGSVREKFYATIFKKIEIQGGRKCTPLFPPCERPCPLPVFIFLFLFLLPTYVVY